MDYRICRTGPLYLHAAVRKEAVVGEADFAIQSHFLKVVTHNIFHLRGVVGVAEELQSDQCIMSG